MKPKIILYCPVRERHDVFAEVLESHRNLAGVFERWYLDDNEDPKTSELLKGKKTLRLTPALPQVAYQGHEWNAQLTARMSTIRNAGIQMFLRTDADALLMVDADLVLHPSTALHLAYLNRSIVSEVFWSKWEPDYPWFPNVWDVQSCGFWNVNRIIRLKEPGTYDVGGLGACTLFQREILKTPGLSYDPIPSVLNWAGEDRHFCVRAQVLGIPLWADTQLPPFHVYRPEMLDEAKAWRAMGCPSEYFSETWLTQEWEELLKVTVKLEQPSAVPKLL
jgi:hypothetical protein